MVCLLAGCATQSTPVGDRAAAEGAAGAAARSTLCALARGNSLCLGIEFLPPAADETAVAVPPVAARAEPVRAYDHGRTTGPPVLPVRYGGLDLADRHTWTMNADDLAALRDPIARETLRFIDLVMGEDRRRVKRELGTPLLGLQAFDLQSPGIDLRAEEAQKEEELEWQAEHGVRFLQRPFTHLLQHLPIFRSVELSIDEFKSDNVPLSQAYAAAHQDARRFGRVSLRLDVNDAADPVEITYIKSGFRIGTSRDRIKLGYRHRLLDNLELDLRASHDYRDSRWRLRADLSWLVSDRTSLHCVAGDDLDFMATSTVYSLFESPMDGSPGLLVYALHLF